MLQFPTIPIVLFSLTFIIIFLCCCLNEKSNKPLIAYDDVLYGNFTKNMLNNTEQGKEIQILHESENKNLCKKSILLFILYIKNGHPLLSLFQRTEGTNYSTKQRLSVFLMFILSILAWSAFFYGWDLTIFGSIMSTFYQSLGSFIPVQIAIILFSQV